MYQKTHCTQDAIPNNERTPQNQETRKRKARETRVTLTSRLTPPRFFSDAAVTQNF